MSRRIIELDMTGVQGDLQIKLEVEANTVTDAWCRLYVSRIRANSGWEGTDRCARDRTAHLWDMQYISIVCGHVSP